jgi:D-amino-acid dehydrogenase
MPHRAVAIGGGAVGTACAYYMVHDGWEATLLDRGQMGHGCPYAVGRYASGGSGAGHGRR